MSDKAKLNRLRCRYAYMVRDPDRIGFYRGWMEPLETLCAELEEIFGDERGRFRFSQIKEKFGACQIYFSFASSARASSIAMTTDRILMTEITLRRLIQERFEAAQNATKVRCMICCSDGVVNNRRALGRRHSARVCPPCNSGPTHGPDKLGSPLVSFAQLATVAIQPLQPRVKQRN
jgi:hypothetical protein